MSHPDPSYDPDNSYEDDMYFNEPSESDVPFIEYLYDDHNDFFDEDTEEAEDDWDDSVDDSMDGDFDSAMRDAGWGTDEDYGYYGDDN